MKVVDLGTQQLPNGLVLHHVTQLEAKYTSQQRLNSIPRNLRDAIREVKKNLSRPPTADPADIPVRGTIPRARIVKLSQRLTGREFRLLPSEALMIINHRPVMKEELVGLIEELEDRMSEEKQDKLLEVVGKVLGNVRAADVNGDAAVDGDEEGEDEEDG